jgi:hypothetical protein
MNGCMVCKQKYPHSLAISLLKVSKGEIFSSGPGWKANLRGWFGPMISIKLFIINSLLYCLSWRTDAGSLASQVPIGMLFRNPSRPPPRRWEHTHNRRIREDDKPHSEFAGSPAQRRGWPGVDRVCVDHRAGRVCRHSGHVQLGQWHQQCFHRSQHDPRPIHHIDSANNQGSVALRGSAQGSRIWKFYHERW